jgi:CheY-like chemotaxis protein
VTLAVLICDDSSLARRQMARSLPADWDIAVSFAEDGKQAIAAIHEGKADLLFLDLNMPVMNGYEVLDQIRADDLPTMVLVVSGDIQAEARSRVMAKGALDFIRKPVAPDQISAVLERYGILSLADSTHPRADPSAPEYPRTDFLQALREVVNIAMGQAGSRLSELLGTFIQLPVPEVFVTPYRQLGSHLSYAQDPSMSAVSHGFSGNGVAGEAIFLMSSDKFSDLESLVALDMPEDSNSHAGILTDLSELLVGSCLKGISQQLDIEFNHSYPVVLGHEQQCTLLLDSESSQVTVLAINISYHLSTPDMDCHLLLLMTEDSIPALRARVESLLQDVGEQISC